MIGPRPLYLAAVLLGVAGLALRVAPAGSPGAPNPLPAAKEIPLNPASKPADPAGYRAIVGSNVFSSSRTAPATRLVPEGLRKDTQVVTPKRAKPAEPRIQLYGITKGVGGAVALVDADPKVPGAEVYRVGDRVRGARISAITDSTVVLARPAGSLVLRLPAAEGAGR